MNAQTQTNFDEIKRQMAAAGIEAHYTGYSDANGISIYFEVEGKKWRFSDHSVMNKHRMSEEVHFPLPFRSTLGLGGVIKNTLIDLFS